MSQSQMNDNSISISRYEDQGTPTLRLDTPSREKLLELRRHIQGLAERKTDNIDLHDLEAVMLHGLVGFTLKLTDVENDSSNKISFVSNAPSALSHVYWSRNAQGWDDCIFWIDGLLNAKIAGHQYLSEKNEGAVVIVSHREHSRGESY